MDEPINKTDWNVFRLINGDFREEVRYSAEDGIWMTRVCDLDGPEISRQAISTAEGERYFARAIEFPNT